MDDGLGAERQQFVLAAMEAMERDLLVRLDAHRQLYERPGSPGFGQAVVISALTSLLGRLMRQLIAEMPEARSRCEKAVQDLALNVLPTGRLQ